MGLFKSYTAAIALHFILWGLSDAAGSSVKPPLLRAVPQTRVCASALGKQNADTGALRRYLPFRKELEEAQLRNIQSGHKNAGFSARFGSEANILVPEDVPNGHVYYFASGPDVYRAIHDFPAAKHFHYVDILGGWGESSNAIIEQFLARVKSLGTDCRVRTVSRGFMNYVRPSILKQRRYFFEHGHESPDLRKPLVIEAQWTSASMGPQVKRFYLHPVRIDDEIQMTELLAAIPRGHSLVGLMKFGLTGLPHKAAIFKMLQRLTSGGAFTFDLGIGLLPELVLEFYPDYSVSLVPLTPEEKDEMSAWAYPSELYIVRK